MLKVKIVYGCSCAGKSTYVKANAGDEDLIWDYDKILMACTNRSEQLCPGHAISGLIKGTRKSIIDLAKENPVVKTLWIPTLWISNKLREEVKGLEVEEIFLDESKETCLERLEKAEDRPDKENWRAVISKWFSEHGEASKVQNQPRKKFWRFVRNEAGERILRLEGIICDNSWADDEISPNKFREELNEFDGDITVWLNSEGGDFWAGVQIYNMLKEYVGRVTIKIDAIAASAASVIAMAGDVVEISAAGMIMIHNPWSMAEGGSAEMKSAAAMLDEVKESLITAYELRTHLPREELSRMMDEETWLHAQKAVELGFADKIIGDEKAPAIEISSRRKVMNCQPKIFRSKVKPADSGAYYKRLNSKWKR